MGNDHIDKVAILAQVAELPAYHRAFNTILLPLIETLLACSASKATTIISISGAIGSGKSTLAGFLGHALKTIADKHCIVISLDDFYLTKAQRQILAKEIHPLLAHRGAPGTHDIALLLTTFHSLTHANAGEENTIVRFDKATDDRAKETHWTKFSGRPDIIFFEGWCVGAKGQKDEDLEPPINNRERLEDPEGIWRNFVNHQLADNYQTVWSLADYCVNLQIPNFECAFNWREKQEQDLRNRAPPVENSQVMNPAQVREFIALFERITTHMQVTLPQDADTTIALNIDHTFAQPN